MGIPYDTFLIIYALAQFAFGVMSQADRRAGTLYGRAFAFDGIGRYLAIATMLGQICALALAVIGFLSLRWYLVIAIFLVAGSIGGIGYALATTKRPGRFELLHNFAAGAAGLIVVALTAFLWVQRITH